jgi:hypothetical protein
MPISLDGTQGINNDATDLNYTGTLTGGTGVVNLGSGQFYKDASGQRGYWDEFACRVSLVFLLTQHLQQARSFSLGLVAADRYADQSHLQEPTQHPTPHPLTTA